MFARELCDEADLFVGDSTSRVWQGCALKMLACAWGVELLSSFNFYLGWLAAALLLPPYIILFYLTT